MSCLRSKDRVRCAYRDRSDRPRLPWSGCRALAECSGVVGHRSRTRPAATRDHDPTRRADGPPEPVLCASSSWKPSRPSVGSARKEEGTNPARLARLGRVHRVGGITPVKHGAGPAVKTGNPSLSPRGARSAVGGIRACAGNPGSRASSSSTVLLARAFMCPRPNCSHASPPSADSARATGPSLSELAHRGVHKPLGVSVCIRLRRQAPPSRVYG